MSDPSTDIPRQSTEPLTVRDYDEMMLFCISNASGIPVDILKSYTYQGRNEIMQLLILAELKRINAPLLEDQL